MKKIKTILFIPAILIFSIVFQSQKQSPPAGGTPKNFSLPEKNVKLLDNGMKGTFVEYGAIPKAVIRIIIKTGNIHEEENQIWLADLTANLMKEGTRSADFTAISRKVAAMGGEINIYTGIDQTTITSTVLSEYADDVIAVLGDVLMNPAFPDSEIDRLKNNLKRQLAIQKAQPRSQASEEFYRIIYPDHPYGRYQPTEEMLDSYSMDMVKDFYAANFGAKRSVMYVAGKFDKSNVINAFENTFSSWVEGPDIDYPEATAVKTNQISRIDRKGAPQTTIMVGLPTITPKDPDFIALELTNSLLGGSYMSRITTNIREDKGYTYSPISRIQTRKNTAVWYELADVSTEYTGASLIEIAKEIKRLQEENPTKEELEGIQNYEAGLFVLRNSTPTGIIQQLNFLDFQGLDDTYLTKKVENIYKVTPEKVSQLTKDYLRYEDMTLVLVGDKQNIERQENELKKSRNLK